MGLHGSLARRLNSSPMVPGTLRQMVGGRFFRTADYRLIGQDQAQARLLTADLDGWQRDGVAQRHNRVWHQGVKRPGSENLTAALRYFPAAGTVLEVGCGTGYNLGVLAAQGVSVLGVDNSAAMLAVAGAGRVVQADAGALPAGTDRVDVVVDGATLIHIVDWQRALAEQARAARHGVILHSVTITDAPTTFLFKRAYGYAVPEVAFNAEDLRTECSRNGLELQAALEDFPYDLAPYVGVPTRAQTWVLAAGQAR